MELEGETVLLGGNLNLSLMGGKTTIVNSIPIAFTIANLPILVATLAFNIWAIFIINKKETSRINRLDRCKAYWVLTLTTQYEIQSFAVKVVIFYI